MSGTLVRPRQRGEPGLKSRQQLERERTDQEEMRREIPIYSETMVEVMARFCAADPDAANKVGYTDAIATVLQDADVHGMSVRDQERLLEVVDAAHVEQEETHTEQARSDGGAASAFAETRTWIKDVQGGGLPLVLPPKAHAPTSLLYTGCV